MENAARGGRPRSEQARTAVLHAVDDLLVDEGYAAMTMKGIAERAGVGRQTVYRWWATKAEILLEASAIDVEEELTIRLTGDVVTDLSAYVRALVRFLAHSPAGAAYRALIGEAQHDAEVAAMMRDHDLLATSARLVVEQALGLAPRPAPSPDHAVALLIGPVVYWVLSGRDAKRLRVRVVVDAFLAALRIES